MRGRRVPSTLFMMIHHHTMVRLIRIYMLVLLYFCALPGASGDTVSTSTKMAEAAISFLAALDEKQKESVLFPIDTNERATWSNLPIIMVQPRGLLIKDMGDEQRKATHALLRASMSSQGYAKVTGIMWLDDVLHEIAQRSLDDDLDAAKDPFRKALVATRGSGNYALALFGEPGKGDWGWKLAGHHVAVNFTVSDNQVAFTPTFLGSNPMAIESGRYAGRMVLPYEGMRGVEFMRSLSKEQQQTATIHPEVADDVFEGPGRRASLAKLEGLKADKLSARQSQLLRLLVFEYLQNAEHHAAGAQLQLIEQAGWDNIWFSWRGPVDMSGRFYYRVHGPRLLIEYNRQNENHDHSVVRDPENDYGEDWLGNHYQEHHPTTAEAMENARRRAATRSDPQ